jgi:hypothetical protein
MYLSFNTQIKLHALQHLVFGYDVGCGRHLVGSREGFFLGEIVRANH